ncbi:MAG TPA: HD domain-containing phosphohydrolase [Longimicrobiales bacterium]|nr:HD domain-containing phosphohydrolase [Longimicrobiales bacterium]
MTYDTPTPSGTPGNPPVNPVTETPGQRFVVVVIDDERLIAEYIARVVEELGTTDVHIYTDPEEVLREWSDRLPDLVVTDYQMPKVNGVELIRRFRERPAAPQIPIIMVTADGQRETRHAALSAGASDFLRKPLDREEVRIRVRNMLALRDGQRSAERRADWLQAEVALATAAIVEREEETILSLARAMEYRDWETGGHIERMATYSRLIAERLDLGPELDPRRVFKAAPLHDVGKIGVPDHILLKPSSLTENEFHEMQKHSQIGYEILKECNGEILRLGSVIALAHHERLDGSGYPQGLKGREIPLVGRIVAVADVFDALTSSRPYKKAWALDAGFANLKAEAGRLYDADCVAAFLDAHETVREVAASVRR